MYFAHILLPCLSRMCAIFMACTVCVSMIQFEHLYSSVFVQFVWFECFLCIRVFSFVFVKFVWCIFVWFVSVCSLCLYVCTVCVCVYVCAQFMLLCTVCVCMYSLHLYVYNLCLYVCTVCEKRQSRASSRVRLTGHNPKWRSWGREMWTSCRSFLVLSSDMRAR